METDLIRKFMEEQVPFNRFLGMTVSDCGEGWAEMKIPFREEYVGDIFRPALHGGTISALIDTVGGAAAMTGIDKEDRLSTIDLRVDYLRPGDKKDLIARAEVVRSGNRVIVTAIRVHQGDISKPIAEGRAVFNLRRKD